MGLALDLACQLLRDCVYLLLELHHVLSFLLDIPFLFLQLIRVLLNAGRQLSPGTLLEIDIGLIAVDLDDAILEALDTRLSGFPGRLCGLLELLFGDIDQVINVLVGTGVLRRLA